MLKSEGCTPVSFSAACTLPRAFVSRPRKSQDNMGEQGSGSRRLAKIVPWTCPSRCERRRSREPRLPGRRRRRQALGSYCTQRGVHRSFFPGPQAAQRVVIHKPGRRSSLLTAHNQISSCLYFAARAQQRHSHSLFLVQAVSTSTKLCAVRSTRCSRISRLLCTTTISPILLFYTLEKWSCFASIASRCS